MTRRNLCQLGPITIISFLILFTYLYLNDSYEHISYLYQQIMNIDLIDSFNNSNEKLPFIIDEGHWNFSLNSYLQMKLEADISPNISSFIQNNAKYLKDYHNINLPMLIHEQSKHYGSMAGVAMKFQTPTKETLILIFSRVWYSRQICYSACNPDRSFVYAEVLTPTYNKISYKLTLNNGKIIEFPSILNITQVETNDCCLGPEDPRIVVNEKNQWILTFNMVDQNKQRNIWFYDLFTNDQAPFSIQHYNLSRMEKNWTPFIKDNELYFIYSYNPLKIIKCPKNNNKNCVWISTTKTSNQIGSLRGGTQLIRYRDSDYFIGIARTTVSCDKCSRFYRPHLVILSTVSQNFRLVYVSEPLNIDSMPIFKSYFMSQNEQSKDFCQNSIRIMTPGSILDQQWSGDKLLFTISINDKRSYIISISGIEKVVDNIISFIRTENSKIFVDKDSNLNLVSHAESTAINYCRSLSTKKTR